MLMKSKPKYKIGTLLRNKNALAKIPQALEQILIVDRYLMIECNKTHEGVIVENEVQAYDLMYLGQKGRKESQTERWLDVLISDRKIEIAATPD